MEPSELLAAWLAGTAMVTVRGVPMPPGHRKRWLGEGGGRPWPQGDRGPRCAAAGDHRRQGCAGWVRQRQGLGHHDAGFDHRSAVGHGDSGTDRRRRRQHGRSRTGRRRYRLGPLAPVADDADPAGSHCRGREAHRSDHQLVEGDEGHGLIQGGDQAAQPRRPRAARDTGGGTHTDPGDGAGGDGFACPPTAPGRRHPLARVGRLPRSTPPRPGPPRSEGPHSASWVAGVHRRSGAVSSPASDRCRSEWRRRPSPDRPSPG